MGMLKEGVRLDRVRGGRQKYRRVTPYTTTPASANNNAGAQAGSTDSNNVNPQPVKKVSLEGMQTHDSSRTINVFRRTLESNITQLYILFYFDFFCCCR
jgi:hypothetical protein